MGTKTSTFLAWWRWWYLVVDEQLGGGVQTLQQHQLVGLRGDGVRQGGPDPSLGGPQPQADGEGPQGGEGMLHHRVHVVSPSGEGQPEALRERRSQDT